MRRTVAILAGCGAMVCAPLATADIIISNLDGNDGSQTADIDDLRTKGMGFTMPSGDGYYIDSATLRLETFGPDITLFVEIWSNAGGVPGVHLFSLDSPSFNPSGIANYDFTAGSDFILEADTTYWLVAYGTADGDRVDWKASSPSQTPTGVATHAGATFGTSGPPPTNNSSILTSYAINATLVPAPAVGLVFGVGVIALRRRRRA